MEMGDLQRGLGVLVILACLVLLTQPQVVSLLNKLLRSTERNLALISSTVPAGTVYSNSFESTLGNLSGRSATVARSYNLYRARSGTYLAKVTINGARGGAAVRLLVPGTLTPGATYAASAYLSESNKKEEFGDLAVAVSINGAPLTLGNDVSPYPWSSWSKSEVRFVAPASGYVDVYFGYGEEYGGEFYQGVFWIDDALVTLAPASGPRFEARLQSYPMSFIPADRLSFALGQITLNAVGSTQGVAVTKLRFRVLTGAPAYPALLSNFRIFKIFNSMSSNDLILPALGINPLSSTPGGSDVLEFNFPLPAPDVIGSITLAPNEQKSFILRANSNILRPDTSFFWPIAGSYTLELIGAEAVTLDTTLKSAGAVAPGSASGSVGGSVGNPGGGSSSSLGPTGNNCEEPVAPPNSCVWDNIDRDGDGKSDVIPPTGYGYLYCRRWTVTTYPPDSSNPSVLTSSCYARGSDASAGTGPLACGIVGCGCKTVISSSASEGEYSSETFIERGILKDPAKPGCCVNIASDGQTVSGANFDPSSQICCPQRGSIQAHVRPRCVNASGGPLYAPNSYCTPPGLEGTGIQVRVPSTNTDGCCPVTNPSQQLQDFLNALPRSGCAAIITSGNSGCHEDDSRHYTGCAVDLITSNLAACGLQPNPPGVYGNGKCTPAAPGSSLYHCQLCETRP